MDVVICVSSKDGFVVKKNIKYIRQYLQQPEDITYVISNAKNKFFFHNKWCKKNKVVFIDEDDMLPGLSMQRICQDLSNHFSCTKYPGWYLQQFLKMGFSLTNYAKQQYLIWDADTFPLRSLKFYEDGKYLLTAKDENHQPYFDTTERLLGFRRLVDYSFIAEHMPIDVSIMRELIHSIEKSQIEGEYWFDKIINATSGKDEQAFSEFETYGNFFVAHYPEKIHPRRLRTLREAGLLFGRAVRRSDIHRLGMMNFDTASFELRDKPRFPQLLFYWWDRCWLALLRRLHLVS